MPPGFPFKWRSTVKSRTTLFLDQAGAIGDRLLQQSHNVGLGLIDFSRWIVLVLAEIRSNRRSGDDVQHVIIDACYRWRRSKEMEVRPVDASPGGDSLPLSESVTAEESGCKPSART